MKLDKVYKKKKYKILPFSVIEAAVGGDTDAICSVIKHYEPYIAKLATRRLYDECGVPYKCVDDELRKRLEIKLIAGILKFKLNTTV